MHVVAERQQPAPRRPHTDALLLVRVRFGLQFTTLSYHGLGLFTHSPFDIYTYPFIRGVGFIQAYATFSVASLHSPLALGIFAAEVYLTTRWTSRGERRIPEAIHQRTSAPPHGTQKV